MYSIVFLRDIPENSFKNVLDLVQKFPKLVSCDNFPEKESLLNKTLFCKLQNGTFPDFKDFISKDFSNLSIQEGNQL